MVSKCSLTRLVNTVLANEQVINDSGWRSGALVEQRELSAVVLQDHRISGGRCSTRSAARSLAGDKVRLMQKNWIGRSEGLLCASRSSRRRPGRRARARGFHDAAGHAVRREFWRWRRIIRWRRRPRRRIPELAAFIAECQHRGTARRPRSTPPRSTASTPASAPCTRSIRRGQLPVYVANFILMDYGTGAIFGCPAHDQRDLDFVNKYGLGNTPVVCPPGQDPATFVIADIAYDGDAPHDQLALPRRHDDCGGQGRRGEPAGGRRREPTRRWPSGR